MGGMNEWMPPVPLLGTFVMASFLLALSPGPGVFYILTRSISLGRRAGMASMAGIALGNFVNLFGSAVGLALLFSLFPLSYLILKYAGAGYLMFLGAEFFVKAAPEASLSAIGQTIPSGRIFRDGAAVALFNPKTTLFFAAFLPQFLGPPPVPLPKILILGLFFVGTGGFSYALYVLASSSVSGLLTRKKNSGFPLRWLAGSLLIGLGLFTAFS